MTANSKLSCSVVIPVYNSQESLALLVGRLHSVLQPLFAEYEVILVNDGSKDKSWQIIEQLSSQHTWVTGINLMRNYGQHNALLCGTRNANYDIVITMDDDLQHPPEEIYKLIDKLQEGYDVVYGSPNNMPHNLWRNLASRVSKRALALVMGIKTVREISAFRAFRTDLRRAFETYESPGVILDVLLSWGTTSFSSVRVNEIPREYGVSNYSFSKLVSQVFLIMTGFSTIPLRFANWLGFVFMIFGIAVFIYVVTIYFTSGSIPGFPFLSSIIALFSGAQLFALGVMGEYLARVFDRSTDRPTYVIGKRTTQNTEALPSRHP